MPADDVRNPAISHPEVPPPAATRTPTEDALKAAEKAFDEAARKDEAALQPMLSYEQRLKEINVSREKAAQIIDAVLLHGYYSEDIQVTKTIKARLRTRGARDTKRAQEMLEQGTFGFAREQIPQDELNRIMLAVDGGSRGAF
jgi:hypothetical protein